MSAPTDNRISVEFPADEVLVEPARTVASRIGASCLLDELLRELCPPAVP